MSMSMSKWIEVNNYKELPTGVWLVKIKDLGSGEITRDIAQRRNNITLVGNHFHFDMSPVIAYYATEVYSL